MALNEFVKELNGERIEGEIIKTLMVSLITSFLTLFLIYYIKLRDMNNFISDYGFFLFFAVLSYALIMPSIRQVRAFKQFPCMTGMMIGMTIGMSVGIFLGYFNGRCCGIMGIMEGLMAGFMGGLMGAMTAIMMYNDNLKLAGVIIFVICSVILLGLNYMLYKETKFEERIHYEDQFITIVLSFLLTVLSIWFMVFGPKGVLFQ